MAWWEGADDEVRVLIAPESDSVAVGETKENLLSLRHPKTGAKTTYHVINESLRELHWFKQSYGSWFLGDYVCEDGSLYTSTPIDPVFIMLPVFEEARMKEGNELGKFRQLDEIIYVEGYPQYQHLLLIVGKCMHVVCEVKEMGSSKFFRLDDTKVLAWLSQKVHRLKQTLVTLDRNYAVQDEKHTLADAVSILGEYLKDEPWLKMLSHHLRLDSSEISKKSAESNELPPVPEMQPTGGFSVQAKEARDKKNIKQGKQAKKVKVEKDSKNIRDMFISATRSGARSKLN